MFSRWWKEQLRKKNKQKRADVDITGKASREKLVDETIVENEDETKDVMPVKKHDRKRKRRKEHVSETLSEDPSFSQPKKKKRDTLDDSTGTEDVKNSTDSTVKKKYILFVGEFCKYVQFLVPSMILL